MRPVAQNKYTRGVSLAFILALLFPGAARSNELSFQRDVRPILSDKCFACHGPDAKNQKSPFRIDSFEEATKEHDGVFGIVPGDVENSEVFWRIFSDDPSEIMPPPKSKMPMTEAEKKIIEQWIESGAKYEEHWSLVNLPEAVEVPEVDQTGYRQSPDTVPSDTEQGTIAPSDHPIDLFVRAQLGKVGLEPSSEVSPEKWLRRVTFDLTGLPPTLEEIDAFLSDESPDAYGKAVDRLLNSSDYAERMTAEWLDVARYSDTYGYQVDRNREVWPWRDWVIRAFEGNMPYDQFITEQVAGDLIPNATRDQILATTFNRLHSQKVEGGSVEEEFRIEYIADRVHTFGTAFLGLSMECCRCHDHKYDALSMKDYYAMSAFFSNIDESGLYSYFTPAVPTPTLELPSEDQEKKLADAISKITGIARKLDQVKAEAAPAFQTWNFDDHSAKDLNLQVHLDFEKLEKGKTNNLANAEAPASSNANNQIVPGKVGNALKLTGDDAVNLPKGVGNFTRDQPFSIALWINAPEAYERAVIVRRSKAWTDAASRGYELLVEDGNLSVALIHFWPGNAIRVRTMTPIPVNRWKHVAFTYDGSSEARGLQIFVDGIPVETEVIRDNLNREIVGGGDDFVGLGQRMRDKGFKNGLVDEFRVYDREISGFEIARLHDPSLQPKNEDKLEFYLSAFHPESKGIRKQLKAAREERSKIQKGIREIMVMREMAGEPRKTFMLDRGMYDSPGEEVGPNTPESLPPLDVSETPNRLDLARWLTEPDHPLTARVTVNRYWQMMFGTGLVSTSEDFGSQGKLPTHPELLDWLARDFVDNGWDLHHLLRQIALSATYRQSANVTSELREKDPENQWLARGPTFKLPAEMIRDNALAISGLLSEKVGGPSVKPYDLAVSFKPIKPDKGEGLYRRSIYTFWKRTGPSPMMMTLDSSKKEVCRVKREETASPLQSLVLLNSPQFIEAARVTAENLIKDHGTDDSAIIEDSFRLLTSRQPDPREISILQQLLEEQTGEFTDAPEKTAAFFKTGDKAPEQKGDDARLAAVTVLVSALMNFDESFTKR